MVRVVDLHRWVTACVTLACLALLGCPGGEGNGALGGARPPRKLAIDVPDTGGLVAWPAAPLGENLLTNPGFEEILSNGKPRGWEDNGFAIDDTVARAGARSYLLADAHAIPYSQAARHVLNLRRGVYQLRLWVKTEQLGATQGSGVRACLSAPPAYPWKLVRACTPPLKGTNDWQELVLSKVSVPVDTPAAVSLEAYGEPDGKAWFDEVELRREEKLLDVFLLYPNYRGLLFDDQPQTVRLHVSTDPPRTDEKADYRVILSVTDESSGTVVQEESFAAEASAVASLDFSTLAQGRAYLVSARLVSTGGAEAVAEYPPYRIWKVPGELRKQMTVSFDERNRILLRGKPSFLLGVYDAGLGYGLSEPWWDETLSNARRLFELPINVYLNYWYGEAGNGAWIPLLNLLGDRGIYALTNANCFGSSPVEAMTPNAWFLKAGADDLAARTSHPAFLGFYAADECGAGLAENVFGHYQRMKRIDPDGMVLGTLLAGPDLPLWRDALDVIATDPYPLYGAEPEGGYPLSRVSEWTRMAGEAVMGSRPVITVIQFFQFTSKGRWPTAKELRNMSYMAIAEGANGLLYWSLGTNALAYVCKDWCEQKVEYFARLKAVLKELKSLEEVLASPDYPELLSTVSEPEAVRVRIKRQGKRAWLFVANVTDKSLSARFVLSVPVGGLRTLPDDRIISEGSSGFEDQLGPYDTRLYRAELP